MSYYWFNRKEVFQKTKEIYSKEKTTGYYLENKREIKKKSRNRYKNLPKKKKTGLKSTNEKDISK